MTEVAEQSTSGLRSVSGHEPSSSGLLKTPEFFLSICMFNSNQWSIIDLISYPFYALKRRHMTYNHNFILVHMN